MLTAEALLSLSLACAPMVHPETALRVVTHESAGNPWAIGINGPYRLSAQPRTRLQAVATAKMLMQAGYSVDLGLGQINSKNLARLNLTPETAFDPCENLRAMQAILLSEYTKATKLHGPGQQALIAALSAYNTGNHKLGVQNGYVGAVLRVPILSAKLPTENAAYK